MACLEQFDTNLHVSNFSSFWISGGVETELFSLQYWTMRSSVSHSLTAIRGTQDISAIPTFLEPTACMHMGRIRNPHMSGVCAVLTKSRQEFETCQLSARGRLETQEPRRAVHCALHGVLTLRIFYQWQLYNYDQTRKNPILEKF